MNLDQLRRFAELADRGSFTRAAERANLTQPALSRSIIQLEEEFGMKLFDRIGRRSELTASGRVLLDRARRVLFEAEEFVRAARLQKEGGIGAINIGLGSTPSALLNGPLLALAIEHSPRPQMTIMRGSIPQQIAALRERTVDMIVVEVSSISHKPDLDIELLEPTPRGFICRSSHPLALAAKRSLAFDDLLPWPMASTLVTDAQAGPLVATYGPKAHPDECKRIRADDVVDLFRVVQKSDVIYSGIFSAALSAIRAGTLVQLPVLPVMPPSQFAIITLAGRSAPPVADLVRQLIRKHMNATAEGAPNQRRRPTMARAESSPAGSARRRAR